MNEHDDIRELAQAGFKQARLDLINLRMENRKLRAELADSYALRDHMVEESRRRYAAIARVRELCVHTLTEGPALLVLRALGGGE